MITIDMPRRYAADLPTGGFAAHAGQAALPGCGRRVRSVDRWLQWTTASNNVPGVTVPTIVVQKYGGSSLADAEGVKRVAKRISETKKAGNDVVVAVSAMGDTTDELLDLAQEVSPLPPPRELDMLMTAGERISMALVAMAINDLGHSARSFTGSQAGVITDSVHGKAKIIDVTPGRITEALGKGHVVIVAGFQGVSQDTKEITTLGRGGTDTTAVALAAALGAGVCEIYTDVDGVFTADPRIVPSARKLDRISAEEMLELAASGSKVLHLRSVEYARRFDIPIHVRSSFSQKTGTVVSDTPAPEGDPVEAPIIAGVAHDRSEAKVTVVGVPDRTGMAARIFRAVSEAQINIDMIVQNVSATETALTDISFTLPKTDGPSAVQAIQRIQADVGFGSIQYDDQIGKLSLVGAGMRSNPGVSATFFAALAEADVNIEMISTSEIRISVITRDEVLDDAVRAVHTAFGLDSTEGEAVVYGGTGR
jgi:aspartate kinase